jgi:alpha-tubulin suppressor-like RCC1 family protein
MNTIKYMTKIVKMIEIECNNHENVCDEGAHSCIFFGTNENYNSCNCGAISDTIGVIMDI